MKKVIIDADPGVDDTFAILLALKSVELDIKAITTVAGNCSLKNANKNTCKILEMINKVDIPVYSGEKKSLNKKNKDASHVHGNNGLGGVKYKKSKKKLSGKNAVDYLINEVNNNPNEITLVAIGPLTNIATAINKDSNFAKNVKSLIIMGGSIEKGNITPYAEFNFYKDPEAAKIVFDSNFNEIIMFGLDVTTKLPLSEDMENVLKNSDNYLANFLYDITRTGAAFDKKMGLGGLILNDPLTIAYLIDSSLVKTKFSNITIEVDGEQMGKSNVSFVDKSNCKVGYDVDSDKFYELLFKRILEIDYKGR